MRVHTSGSSTSTWHVGIYQSIFQVPMIFSFSRHIRSKKQLTNIKYLNCYVVALDNKKDALTWKERLQIAVDAAQGLLA